MKIPRNPRSKLDNVVFCVQGLCELHVVVDIKHLTRESNVGADGVHTRLNVRIAVRPELNKEIVQLFVSHVTKKKEVPPARFELANP